MFADIAQVGHGENETSWPSPNRLTRLPIDAFRQQRFTEQVVQSVIQRIFNSTTPVIANWVRPLAEIGASGNKVEMNSFSLK